MAYAKKMATKAGKYKAGGAKKAFKAHPMYSKSGKMVMAKKMADHLRLKKLGYTHTKPKKKK